MDKRALSKRDICTKFITPALRQAGWDEMSQIREEVSFTKGRIIVRGKLVSRGKGKRADYILCYKPNIPIEGLDLAVGAHPKIVPSLRSGEWRDARMMPLELRQVFEGDGFRPDGLIIRSGPSWMNRRESWWSG
jgi:type I restriction enzyme R subunit